MPNSAQSEVDVQEEQSERARSDALRLVQVDPDATEHAIAEITTSSFILDHFMLLTM